MNFHQLWTIERLKEFVHLLQSHRKNKIIHQGANWVPCAHSVSLSSEQCSGLVFLPEGTGICRQNQKWLFLLSGFLSSVGSVQFALWNWGNSSLPLPFSPEVVVELTYYHSQWSTPQSFLTQGPHLYKQSFQYTLSKWREYKLLISFLLYLVSVCPAH